MLRSLKDLRDYSIDGKDGNFGKVKDFYFDSEELITRYVVVDSGNWLTGEKVLVSTDAFKEVNWEDNNILVDLNKDEMEEGPSLDQKKPVSRKMEKKLTDYYNWPDYWSALIAPHASGTPLRPTPIEIQDLAKKQGAFSENDQNKNSEDYCAEDDEECYLRSEKEVEGYNIQASDGEIGHLEEVIVDDKNWVVRYLVVDTRDWLPGKKVLIAPEWLDRISWNEKKVYVNLTREEIKNAPEYDKNKAISRKYEKDLYDYYQKDKYWNKENNG